LRCACANCAPTIDRHRAANDCCRADVARLCSRNDETIEFELNLKQNLSRLAAKRSVVAPTLQNEKKTNQTIKRSISGQQRFAKQEELLDICLYSAFGFDSISVGVS
jgi:hypothetical protein